MAAAAAHGLGDGDGGSQRRRLGRWLTVLVPWWLSVHDFTGLREGVRDKVSTVHSQTLFLFEI